MILFVWSKTLYSEEKVESHACIHTCLVKGEFLTNFKYKEICWLRMSVLVPMYSSLCVCHVLFRFLQDFPCVSLSLYQSNSLCGVSDPFTPFPVDLCRAEWCFNDKSGNISTAVWRKWSPLRWWRQKSNEIIVN